MEHDKLIERMAEAICDGMGLREWGDVPADRGDLRMRIRSGENYDVNEPNHIEDLTARIAELEAEVEAIKYFRAQFAPGVLEGLYGSEGQ